MSRRFAAAGGGPFFRAVSAIPGLRLTGEERAAKLRGGPARGYSRIFPEGYYPGFTLTG